MQRTHSTINLPTKSRRTCTTATSNKGSRLFLGRWELSLRWYNFKVTCLEFGVSFPLAQSMTALLTVVQRGISSCLIPYELYKQLFSPGYLQPPLDGAPCSFIFCWPFSNAALLERHQTCSPGRYVFASYFTALHVSRPWMRD